MFDKLYKICLIVIIVAIAGMSLTAQTDLEKVKNNLPKMLGASNAGTEFWFSFHPCWETEGQSNSIKVYVSAQIVTQVTLEIPGKGIYLTKMTIPNDVVEFSLTPVEGQCYTKTDTQQPQADLVYNCYGIHVFSDDPIICYGVTRYHWTSDGFLALPVSSLGKEYRVASYADPTENSLQWLPGYTSITAAFDNTAVDFYMGGTNLSHTASGLHYPNYNSKILNKGDVWLIATGSAFGDLSGSKITADKPVAVTSGNYCAYIPSDRGYCDYTIEMEIPVYTWGTEYLVTRIANRKNSSIIKIFSQEANTNIYRDGILIQSLPEGYGLLGEGYIEMRANTDMSDLKPVVISADKPISVTQYNPGQEDDNVVSDPFQLELTPFQQYRKEIVFNTPGIKGGLGFPTNYVNLVYKKGETQIVPDDLEFAKVDNGEYTWEKISLMGDPGEPFANLANGDQYYSKIIELPGDGVYKIRANDPFAAYAYGFSDYDSYGFPANVALVDLNIDDNDPPEPIWAVDSNGNVSAGIVQDMPLEDSHRSNLSYVAFNKASSTNYTFQSREFIPGDDRSTTWSLSVIDPAKDATAFITFSDRCGNDTTIEIKHLAGQLAVNDPKTYLSDKVLLEQNFPNPVSDNTATIKFYLPRPAQVQLMIFDIKGSPVMEVLKNAAYNFGYNQVDINLSSLNPGTYEYRLNACGQALSRKMIITR